MGMDCAVIALFCTQQRSHNKSNRGKAKRTVMAGLASARSRYEFRPFVHRTIPIVVWKEEWKTETWETPNSWFRACRASAISADCRCYALIACMYFQPSVKRNREAITQSLESRSAHNQSGGVLDLNLGIPCGESYFGDAPFA